MAYLSEIIVGGVTYGFEDEVARNMKPVTDTVTLTAAGWTGSGPYTQAVTIAGATAQSRVDMQPDETVLTQMLDDGVNALFIKNDNGTLTATALGAAPKADLSVQVTITEVK